MFLHTFDLMPAYL